MSSIESALQLALISVQWRDFVLTCRHFLTLAGRSHKFIAGALFTVVAYDYGRL